MVELLVVEGDVRSIASIPPVVKGIVYRLAGIQMAVQPIEAVCFDLNKLRRSNEVMFTSTVHGRPREIAAPYDGKNRLLITKKYRNFCMPSQRNIALLEGRQLHRMRLEAAFEERVSQCTELQEVIFVATQQKNLLVLHVLVNTEVWRRNF